MHLIRELFDPEHEEFRGVVRRFIDEHISAHHAAWEREGDVPRSLWVAAGEAGLLGAGVPREHGGLGSDFRFLAVLAEELARTESTGPAFVNHLGVAVPYIVNFGSSEQKAKWLPSMVAGEVLVCLALTEPDAGSDLRGISTRGRPDGDDTFVLSGSKIFITNGASADVAIIAAKTPGPDDRDRLSLFLCETDRPGFSRSAPQEKMGWHAQATVELHLDNVRLPATNLLGGEGQGMAVLRSQLAQERLLLGMRAVATMEAALEHTREHVAGRRAFDQTLLEMQNTRFKMADMVTETAAARALVDYMAGLHTRGELAPAQAAMAKLFATETQTRVLDGCVQLFGGRGYMWDNPVTRAYAGSRVMRIGGGTSEIMREVIAREL